MILSTAYDVGDRYLGRSKDELLALVPRVADGSFRFDEREVELLAAFGEAITASPSPRRTVVSGFLLDNAVVILILLVVLLILCIAT